MKKIYDKYSWLIIILLIVVLCLMQWCKPTPVKEKPIAKKIEKDLEKQAEAKKEARRADSVRTIYVDRWHKVKQNPIKLPCDTFLKIVIATCDTVIQKDSTEIVALKKVVLQDSILIVDYQELHRSDSTELSGVQRKLRWQKRFTKLAFITGLGLGGYGGLKLGR